MNEQEKFSAEIKNEQGVHNVTEELKVMYDAIVGSMDWGSGFLDTEDAESILRIGQLCGFETGEYTIAGGKVELYDAEGVLLNAATNTYQEVSGYGNLVSTGHGRVFRVDHAAITVDSVITKVVFRSNASKADNFTAHLSNPIEVWTVERAKFEFPMPEEMLR